MALATNTQKERLEQILNDLQLSQYFEVALSSNDVLKAKPNPEIYLKVADKLKIPTNQCIVVEDSKSGITAAKKAGMKVIAIKDHRFNIDQREANHVIEDLTEICDLLTINEN